VAGGKGSKLVLQELPGDIVFSSPDTWQQHNYQETANLTFYFRHLKALTWSCGEFAAALAALTYGVSALAAKLLMQQNVRSGDFLHCSQSAPQ
jgi:hypothetical protein